MGHHTPEGKYHMTLRVVSISYPVVLRSGFELKVVSIP